MSRKKYLKGKFSKFRSVLRHKIKYSVIWYRFKTFQRLEAKKCYKHNTPTIIENNYTAASHILIFELLCISGTY